MYFRPVAQSARCTQFGRSVAQVEDKFCLKCTLFGPLHSLPVARSARCIGPLCNGQGGISMGRTLNGSNAQRVERAGKLRAIHPRT